MSTPDLNEKNPLSLFPALKARYPEDIERLQQDEARVTALIQAENFYGHPVMQALLANCRRDVVKARHTLATDRTLLTDPEAQAELWAVIDSRMWFIKLAAQNYTVELDALATELERELNREN